MTWLGLMSTFDKDLLFRSIAGLTKLKHLHVESRIGDERWFKSMTTLFFCLPMSLVSLVLRSGSALEQENVLTNEEERDSDPIVDSPNLRNGPLLHLKELELPIHNAVQLSEYGRILEHCPNVDTFSLRPFDQNSVPVIKDVAPLVKRFCQHIRNIKASRATSWWYVWNPFDILGGVHSTLESLQLDFYDQGCGQVGENLTISSFLHHSVTLRDIRLVDSQSLSNKAIQSIVTTCASLERLEISGRSDNRAVAELPEIVAHKWVCNGLKYLKMTIDWGQFVDPTPPHLPAYYLQQSSTPPSLDQDQERWDILERLYRQIGSLIELEVLDLSACINRMAISQYKPKDPDTPRRRFCGSLVDTSFRSQDRFPLLLSLGVHGGRQGYLSWLSGLKNLKELRGSVHLGNPEVAMTLKQGEVEWMVEHWPKLQVLELLPHQDEAPAHVDVDGYAHVNWLLRRKPTLDLRRRWKSPNYPWDGLWKQDELDGLLTACCKYI
ncbi:hypothetical protein BGZ96_004937 [Linnemannia gamsii]|uniref:F-box domain-containing protein n=1 Tax=Linnemannia gamsii TaxID=64522 RepID=A0ABQ7K6E7_9FUNG|nr:hypothetical protein BGZ96_004937 [Linnemannia gamsii]